MASSYLLLLILTVTLPEQIFGQQRWRNTDDSPKFSGYNESCSTDSESKEKPCDYLKFLECSNQNQCECKVDPDAEYLYNYDPEKDSCMPIPVPRSEPRVIDVECEDQHDCWNSHYGEYSKCNLNDNKCMCWDVETNGQKEVIMVDNKCYILKRRGDYCETDAECNATIVGEAVCVKQTIQDDQSSSNMNSNLGTCACHPTSFWDNRLQECLKIADTGIQFTCKSDLQCSHPTALGNLARCNETTRKCDCFDVNTNGKTATGEYNGKCYLKLKVNDTCSSDIQCKLGSGQDSHCIEDKYNSNAKYCDCHSTHVWGESHLEDDEKCLLIGKYQSQCTSDNQCQHENGLGALSKCAKFENNPRAGQCICWDTVGEEIDTTGHFNGVCYYKRGREEKCYRTEECIVGWSQNAICKEHESYNGEKVCQCPENTVCNSAVNFGGLFSTTFLTIVIFIYTFSM